MASEPLTVREYYPDDAPMVREWWRAHRTEPFPDKLLPPVGVIVERSGAALAACWLFMAVGIGVCWLEYPVSRPGLAMSEAREAFACAVGALERVAVEHDYGIMSAHTIPPIARALRGLGFQEQATNQVAMSKPLWPKAS